MWLKHVELLKQIDFKKGLTVKEIQTALRDLDYSIDLDTLYRWVKKGSLVEVTTQDGSLKRRAGRYLPHWYIK